MTLYNLGSTKGKLRMLISTNKFIVWISSYKKKLESDNQQTIIDNFINLLNGVTTKYEETNFSCKRLQIKTTSGKASHINETISFNRFSIAQNKNQLNVAKEQFTVAPSDASSIQNIENFQNCNTVSDGMNNQCNWSPEAKQQEQEEINKAKLDNQLKETLQQYHTVFSATKQQLVQIDKSTKNISLENETNY